MGSLRTGVCVVALLGYIGQGIVHIVHGASNGLSGIRIGGYVIFRINLRGCGVQFYLKDLALIHGAAQSGLHYINTAL